MNALRGRLSESRVRENFMHGLMRGSRKQDGYPLLRLLPLINPCMKFSLTRLSDNLLLKAFIKFLPNLALSISFSGIPAFHWNL